MVRNNPRLARGVQYFGPGHPAPSRPSEPASNDPGGSDAYQGVSAISGNPPWHNGPGETPAPYTNHFAQIFYRPPVWRPGTPTGSETPMTAAPEEQAPLADLEVNPSQIPFAADDVVVDSDDTVDDQPTIKDLGDKQRPPFSGRAAGTLNDDQYSTGGGVTGEGLIGDDPKISVSDVEEIDPGTEPEPGDLPTGDVRWGRPDCRSIPGPLSTSKAVIFGMRW